MAKRRLTEKENQRYYREVEDYDWVRATDNLLGLESFFHRWREKIILKTLDRYQKNGRFLDAGCGTGLILRHLPAGSVGIDINPRYLKRAKIYAPQAKLVLADISRLPFKKATFANVVVTDVLEHLLRPEKALRELARVMKPGAVLVATIPSRSPLWHLRFLSSTRPHEPYHGNYKKSEVASFLRKMKFQILALSCCLFGMEILVVAIKAKD